VSRKGQASPLEAGRGKLFPACELGKGHFEGMEAKGQGSTQESQETGLFRLEAGMDTGEIHGVVGLPWLMRTNVSFERYLAFCQVSPSEPSSSSIGRGY